MLTTDDCWFAAESDIDDDEQYLSCFALTYRISKMLLHVKHVFVHDPIKDCFFLILPDDNTLVMSPPLHELVSVVRDGKDMRRHVTNLLVLIVPHVCLVVDIIQLW